MDALTRLSPLARDRLLLGAVLAAAVGLGVALIRAPLRVGDVRQPFASATEGRVSAGGSGVTVAGTASCARVDDESGTLLPASATIRVRVSQGGSSRGGAAEGQAGLVCHRATQAWTVSAASSQSRMVSGPARVCVTIQWPRGAANTTCTELVLEPAVGDG